MFYFAVELEYPVKNSVGIVDGDWRIDVDLLAPSASHVI